MLYQTEHPRIIIRKFGYKDKRLRNVPNFDKLHSIVNFASPRYHIVNRIDDVNNVYKQIEFERCLRREVELRTIMLWARKEPDVFAYSLMGKPDYSAFIRGEAAHIYQCMPISVQPRSTRNCFFELPIIANSKYLTNYNKLQQERQKSSVIPLFL